MKFFFFKGKLETSSSSQELRVETVKEGGSIMIACKNKPLLTPHGSYFNWYKLSAQGNTTQEKQDQIQNTNRTIVDTNGV